MRWLVEAWDKRGWQNFCRDLAKIAAFRRQFQRAGLGILGFFLIFPINSFAKTPLATETSSNAQQLHKLDAEITLLKAELARQRGDVEGVRQRLSQVDIDVLSPSEKVRFKALQAYLMVKQSALDPQSSSIPPSPTFQCDPSQALAILPLSGPYAPMGNAVYQGLQAGRSSTLPVIDSALFSSAKELWALVTLYHPHCILGPLTPKWSLAISRLDANIPLLSFNAHIDNKPFIRSLAPNKQDRLLFLNLFLRSLQTRRVGVIYQSNKPASHYALWRASLPTGFRVMQSAPIQAEGVDQAFAQLLHTTHSLGRIHWLQKILGHALIYQVYARKDLDTVVMFSSVEQAIQGHPLLSYYHLDDRNLVWMPEILPSQSQWQQNLPIWQQTYAILPSYFHWDEQEELQKTRSKGKVGTFYALGKSAVKLLENLHQEAVEQGQIHLPKLFQTPIGKVWVNQQGIFKLLPQIVWLNEGAVSQMEITPMLQLLMESKTPRQHKERLKPTGSEEVIRKGSVHE